MSEPGDRSYYFEQERTEVAPLLPPSFGRALEVGCGAGGFGRLMRDKAPASELWGVEPDARSAELARATFDNVICGSFPADELEGETFDLLVFNDVLEHMVDPWEGLNQAKSLLSGPARVIASIPNVRHWDVLLPLLRGRWDYEADGILDRTHLRFFTRATACELFQSQGFQVDRVRPIRRFVRTRPARVAERLTGGQTSWGVIQWGIQAHLP